MTTNSDFKKNYSLFIKKPTYSIEVFVWEMDENFWIWNVYVYLLKTNKLFNDVKSAKNLPFHGGCTLDKFFTNEPALGIEYEWQKEDKTLKVGCDYNHLDDDYYNKCNPDNGIPPEIISDVDRLIQAVEEFNNDIIC